MAIFGAKRHRVVEAITERIVSGELLPGDRLPPERELAAELGVSRETVRGAMHQLAENGQLTSKQGSAWYVRDPRRLRFPLHTIDARRVDAPADVWDSFVEAQGRQGGAILTVDPRATPPEFIRRKLEIPKGEPAVRRHRIRFVDGEKWMISTGWWPLWLAENTPIEGDGSCSPLSLAITYGHGQVVSEAEVGSRMPTAGEAETLDTGRGVPVMDVFTTGRDADGRAIRCTADVFPAHRFLLVFQRNWAEQ